MIDAMTILEVINPIFGNTALTALVAFLIYVILLIPFTKILGIIVLRLTKKTKTKADDLLAKRLYKWVFYFLFFIGLRFTLIYSNVFIEFIPLFTKIIDSLLVLIVAYSIYVVIDVFIDVGGGKWASKTKSTVDDSLIPLARKFTKLLFMVFGILIVLSKWGIDITALVAGLGIAGIAISFAVKDSLSNIFGGVSIILDQSFKVGDKIKIDSGEVGVVEDIGLRSTKIKNYDNQIIILPNGYMANAKVINYAKPNNQVKFRVNFGVEYGTKTEKVKKVVIDALNKTKNVLKDPAPGVVFKEMGDSALIFQAMAWVDDYNDAFMAKEEATSRMYDALNQAKIGIPFPQMDVHLKKR
jgi:MscS family membrane protein